MDKHAGPGKAAGTGSPPREWNIRLTEALEGDVIHTTLRLLKEHGACAARYKYLCKALGGAEKYGRDTPITFPQLVEINGLDDALWALRAVPAEQAKARDLIARLFACACAEHVLPIYEIKYPNDNRVRLCIKASRKFAYGEITELELSDAARAAWTAADAAWAARGAGAARAADAAWNARAAGAAGAAWNAVGAVGAARHAETDWQKELFLTLLTE